MSHYPPHGPYPPPYYGSYPQPPGGYPPPPPPPPGHRPPGHHHPPPPPPHPAYYVPGAVMMPYPMYPSAPLPEGPAAAPGAQPTYVTNYIYHTPLHTADNPPPVAPEPEMVQVVEVPVIADVGELEWVPATSTTSRYLQGRAVVAGHEGWDGSPLWVVRAAHGGDLLPGKLSVRHNAAYVPYNGKEVPVQNIEVLCARPGAVRWVPGGQGRVPAGAVPGGHTAAGEQLYVGRARHQLSLTPGKVHPSHQTCYISFGGNEVSHKMYDVLCGAV